MNLSGRDVDNSILTSAIYTARVDSRRWAEAGRD